MVYRTRALSFAVEAVSRLGTSQQIDQKKKKKKINWDLASTVKALTPSIPSARPCILKVPQLPEIAVKQVFRHLTYGVHFTSRL